MIMMMIDRTWIINNSDDVLVTGLQAYCIQSCVTQKVEWPATFF